MCNFISFASKILNFVVFKMGLKRDMIVVRV